MASLPEPTFTGWLAYSPEAVKGQLQWATYVPKSFTPTDVDIEITHCGVCGSDIHTLRSGWGPTNCNYRTLSNSSNRVSRPLADFDEDPACVGHEIVGYAIRVGYSVTGVRVGDRVGVGAQSNSCLEKDKCEECGNGRENYCTRGSVATYNGKYKDGSKSWGGYARFARVPEHFVFQIPDGIESAHVAPMMCGGITAYTPLVENGAGPGMKVGIVGVGGLGHFGILFAKALGCEEVVAISRSRNKEKDSRRMGATGFIATGDDTRWARKHARSLDLILCTVGDKNLPLGGYLGLLKVKGSLIQVGAPEGKVSLNLWGLLGKAARLGGSSIGSPEQMREMLDLAARKRVKPWVQEFPMKEANRAIVEFEEGKPRYRYVLVNEQKEKL